MLLALFKPKRTKISVEKIQEIYRKKGVLVFRRCRIILQNEATAEDVLQEVFIRLMRYGGSLENDEIPLSWLYRTAERCCFDRLRRDGRERAVDPESISDMDVYPDIETSVASIEIITKYLCHLDDKLKQVALLYYLDGLSQERIAEELGWSRRTVGKKIAQLKKRASRLKKDESNR